MRIGVNTLFLIPGEVGGTETYLCQTLTAIALNHADVGMVLFTNTENDAFLKQRFAGFSQIEFVSLGFAATNRYSRIIREQVQLPTLVKKSRVEVLWSPGYTAPFFCACPQVVTIPDMQYKSYPQDMTLIARITTDVLVKSGVRRCRRIIAISGFSKNEIMKFTSAKGEAIDVTHLAADPAFGERVSDVARKRAMQSLCVAEKPYILCVSNTYPHKNVCALVEAFGELTAEIPHQLIIIGKPRFGEAAVQTAISKLADRSRVSRVEYVRLEDLPAIYQAADLFVFPSLYEGFGLPVLEAMTAGVPVVTMRLASIPEIGGDCVCYADHSDYSDLAAKMKNMLQMNTIQRREWCDRAKAQALSFSWRNTADITVASLSKAIGCD